MKKGYSSHGKTGHICRLNQPGELGNVFGGKMHKGHKGGMKKAGPKKKKGY